MVCPLSTLPSSLSGRNHYALEVTSHCIAVSVLSSLSALFPYQCLCLSPTYELALQTGKVIEQMGKFYPELKLAYAVRGNKCEYEYVILIKGITFYFEKSKNICSS